MSQDMDRKRPFEETEDSSNKRFDVSSKPLQKLSEDGPLTQQDVVYFQKEAIWRQMNVYKQQMLALKKDLAFFKSNYEANESKLNIVDLWYEQIVKLFGIGNKEFDDDEGLLIRLTNQSNSAIDEKLNQRRENLIKLLKPIIENNDNFKVESKELFSKYEDLNKEFIKIKSEKETIEKFKCNLENKLELLQEELDSLHKKQLRNKSKSLKRVDESLVEPEEHEHSNGHSNGTVKKEESLEANAHIKKPDDGSDAQIHKEENEKLTIEIEQLKSLNQLLKKQFDEVDEKHNQLVKQNFIIESKLNNLDEEDLQKNSQYQAMVNQNKKLEEEIDHINKIKDQLVFQISKLEAEKQDLDKLINQEILEENKSLKNQLNKSETDLVRIRTARDELLSKQTILKLEIENKKTNEEVNKLNKILSAKIEQLQQHQHDNNEVDAAKYESMDKSEIIKIITNLEVEIKEIEKAFQEVREISIKKFDQVIEADNVIKKLTIEKTKADQKYFASMRLKDSLNSENKILKIQINKSQELINKFNDLEKNYTKKIEILTKNIEDYKTIKENSILENSKLIELNKANGLKIANYETEIKNLKKLILEKNELSNQQANANKQQEMTISKLEIKLKNVESLLEKYKSNNTLSLLQEDEKQLEALRSIAKCSVCSRNWKDTVITVCGHVFCNGCTQERLAARLRRCPSCNRGFSANDLLSIHL